MPFLFDHVRLEQFNLFVSDCTPPAMLASTPAGEIWQHFPGTHAPYSVE